MENYDVYGIGSAIVDIEYRVDEWLLEEFGIRKGIMTLIDDRRRHEIIRRLEGVSCQKHCGGSGANTVTALALLGGRPFFSCRIADDELGRFCRNSLDASGVFLSGTTAEGTTGQCFVFVTPDAERTMNTFLGVAGRFSMDELQLDELKKSRYLYIEGYLVLSDNSKRAVLEIKREAEKRGVPVALTFSDPSIAIYHAEVLREVIGGGVDLLFCNEEEALAFSGKNSFDDAVSELKGITKLLAVTRGPQGAYLWDGRSGVCVSAPSVEAVDTTGAGDIFAGSFLYGITNGMGTQEAGGLACAAASRLVTKWGATLSGEEMTDVKRTALRGH